ncbi:MAG: hypothetical protein ACREXU_06025, partial [Gammaproteobacteria bacterium]
MPKPDAASPADPRLLTLFQEELARAATLPARSAAGPILWPRFAGFYQGLARLPRKARRALQRRWRRSLSGLALLCALGQAPALAATIVVDGTTCTLVDAITAANSDAAAGGCTAGSGADTISLPIFPSPPIPVLITVNNTTYGPTGLPVITSEITISGRGFSSPITRDSSAPLFRILAVGAAGNLTLRGTRVTGGRASDSCPGFPVPNEPCRGGGIFNRGTLTLT